MNTLNKTCLLVDDDLDDQEIFILALQQIGDNYNCILANNGFEAMDQLKNRARKLPDYIFLDLNMPRMNGKEFLIEIKKHPELRHIPVIIYTTSSFPDDKVQTQKLGAAGYIIKPFSIPELAEKLSAEFNAIRSDAAVPARH